MFFRSGRRALSDDVLHGGLIDLIPLDTAHFHKGALGIGIIIGNEIGAGEVELLWTILQNGLKFRNELGQLDGLSDLVLGDAEELGHQRPGGILLARFA